MKVEEKIENNLIHTLKDLKYEYRSDINDKATLEANFRAHFEDLNKVKLTNTEFARLLEDITTADVFEASKKLRARNTFQREDGTPLQYTLVNINDWCKNNFEVINQLRINTNYSHHRYDVIILINGVPVVQIELKAYDISPRMAMEQIVEYKNDTGNGYTNSLLCFMQLFIVSNESITRYFANNRKEHFSFNADERFLPIYELAKEDNTKISNLLEFSEIFLAKCTLAQLISRYMVLVATEQKLMIMRPYQIYAVKAIVDCINQNRGNGYIWHTTGSGKTLTSFKAATLLKDNQDIEKCIFVVDRKDLDKQTRDEFNKFQEGCVEQNTNTEQLVQNLLSDDYSKKVIVTTIQKFGLALSQANTRAQGSSMGEDAHAEEQVQGARNKPSAQNPQKQLQKPSYKERLAPIRNKRMVIIFDECHRSQFGENHKLIKEFFPKSQLFGFTGTPIFEENANYMQRDGNTSTLRTTKDIFEKELHAYTITHAIDDKNVLKFHVDYFKPEMPMLNMPDAENKSRTPQSQHTSQKAIVESILNKHNAATNNRQFNALFATASINDAIRYYQLFKEIQAERQQTQHENNLPTSQPLNIACVFSPPTSVLPPDSRKDVEQLQEELIQESADNMQDPQAKKEALEKIIADYNTQYRSNFTIYDFDNYYQDIQRRIKDHQYPNSDYPHKDKIDIVIVVDMLLTGFDSKYLNTLYVDKNLKHHGLIQAFSRTNRILNDTKPYGNILDFRQQQAQVDEAITLFSGQKDLSAARQIFLVDSSAEVVKKFDAAVYELEQFMKSEKLPFTPSAVSNLRGESARREFISKYKEIQRLKIQLKLYTDLSEEENTHIETRLPENLQKAFQRVYLDLAQELRARKPKKRNDTEIEELEEEEAPIDVEYILFHSADIDYDYIMKLLSSYTQTSSPQKISKTELIHILKSSPTLRDESNYIDEFVDTLSKGVELNEDEIKDSYQAFKLEKIDTEISAIANSFGLDTEAVHRFVDTTIELMRLDAEKLADLMTPLDLGWKEQSRKEQALMEALMPQLHKLSNGHKISGIEVYL